MICVMRRNEYHVQDESDKDRQKRNQVREPVRDAVVALKGLVDEADEELRPDKDERRGDRANHREAREHLDEVQELPAKGLRQIEGNEQRSKQRSDGIEDERAAIDQKQHARRYSQKPFNEAVADNLHWREHRWHRRILTGCIEQLSQLIE